MESIGGIDESVLLGARLVIHSIDGPIQGVFGKKAIHLQSQEETSHVPEPESMWIDVGATSRRELEEIIPLGTYVGLLVEFVMTLEEDIDLRPFNF